MNALRPAFRTCLAAGVAVLLLLPLAALAGTTKLMGANGKRAADLRGYDRLVVADFSDASEPKFDKPEDEAEYRAMVAEGGKRMADMVVAMLAGKKGFDEITREPVTGKHMVLGGRITAYKESNAVARYVGLGIGGSQFDATIEVKDGESGELLGSMTVAIGSSPIPGATNAVQTVGFLMDSAAQSVRDEMLIAKRVLHREETGRAGRLREKYKSSN